MVVPDELALELDQLHLLTVQLADDLGRPMIAKARELLRQIDLVHDPKVAQKPGRLPVPIAAEVAMAVPARWNPIRTRIVVRARIVARRIVSDYGRRGRRRRGRRGIIAESESANTNHHASSREHRTSRQKYQCK